MADRGARKTLLDWFEIPAVDIERAARVCGTILDAELEVIEVNPHYPMTVLPAPEHGVGGALVQGEGYTPSSQGVFVWLHGGPDLNEVLDRVVASGGKVLMPKTSIGDHGFAASFQDTEGNRVGLHSAG